MEKEMVTLVSSDGEKFNVEREVAELSETIRDLLDCCGNKRSIPLFAVNSEVLRKVIDYSMKKVMNALDEEWDTEHLKGDLNMLHDLLMASSYLNIPPLLDLTCLATAEIIRGKRAEEIRRTFNIKNDFTPEEEVELRAEHGWAFQ